MDRRKVTNDRARSRWVRTSEYTKSKGRTLYAIYVDGYRYDMSRGKTYIGIVGWCYTDRNKAVRDAWNILDENWEDLVENSPADPLGEYPVSVVEIHEDRAKSPDAYNHDPEWYEGKWTPLKYGDEPWSDGENEPVMNQEKSREGLKKYLGRGR